MYLPSKHTFIIERLLFFCLIKYCKMPPSKILHIYLSTSTLQIFSMSRVEQFYLSGTIPCISLTNNHLFCRTYEEKAEQISVVEWHEYNSSPKMFSIFYHLL